MLTYFVTFTYKNLKPTYNKLFSVHILISLKRITIKLIKQKFITQRFVLLFWRCGERLQHI